MNRNENSQAVDSLLERMKKHGWIQNVDIKDADQMRKNISPLGLQRMSHLASIFKDEFPLYFSAKDTSILKPEHFQNAGDKFAKCCVRIKETCGDLQPPDLSIAELNAVFQMTVWYAKATATE